MIAATTEGTITGTAYISGTPIYDENLRKIVLIDTKFKLQTKNIFQKSLTFLFQKKIVNMIEKEYGIPTKDLEEASQKSIEEAFNKEYYKGLKMNGKVFSLKPSTILVYPEGITAVINTSATLQLLVKGM